ncbi:MAG TPA: pitrilysin family protein [Candidatus Acidoferrales bacterium]|nr:pitrilysin family protein [Candidatus Acidoferrales bacterium]
MAFENGSVQQTTLPNGLVVVTEPMANVHSVSAGIWIRTGSRAEPSERSGISHFIEHMVFKGTGRRKAEDIAREVDSVGGMVDAFTAKEMVCFNTRVLDEHLEAVFDVLADMVIDPQFPAEEIDRERSVILEEIRMVEDNPEDLVHEMFSRNLWGAHALGRPILGIAETVEKFDRDTLRAAFRSWYAPNNMVITAAGNISHQQLLDLVEPRFGSRAPVRNGHADAPPAPAAEIISRSKSELEQVHICIGVPACSMTDSRRYAVALLNNILGSGMSSRLFQNIREKQGLAYAVFSETNHYHDAGMLCIYAGTSLETVEQLIGSVTSELRNLKSNGVTADELRRSKANLKGATLLSLESTGSRMSDLARQYLYFGSYISPAERIAAMEAVTLEEIQRAAQEMFQPSQAAAAVLGNLNGFKLAPSQFSF